MKISIRDNSKSHKKMSKIFVCFIGSDGSGKSTIVAKTFEMIRKRRKIKARKVYGGNSPVITKFAMIAGRRLFLKDSNMYSDYDKYLNSKKAFYRKASKFVHTYISLLIIEYYFKLLFKVIIPYKIGYSIIADRYVYDIIINNLAIDKDLPVSEVNSLLDKFWFFIPRPDITFLLQVPEDVALKRKNDIPSLSYLKIRNKFYEDLTKSEQIVILDGTLSILELEKKVLDEIDKVAGHMK
jgi:thymidylate kinase